MPVHRTRYIKRPVSWKDLFSQFFYSIDRGKQNRVERPKGTRMGPFPLGDSSFRHRYPGHEKFLRENRDSVRSFADIGCSFKKGAPTTIDAKEALGKRSIVHAIDMYPPRIEVADDLRRRGIESLTRSIVDAPLEEKYDAIRFANISYHMSQSDRRRALKNIWASLKEGGYLLGGNIPPISVGSVTREFVLQKKGKGFEILL